MLSVHRAAAAIASAGLASAGVATPVTAHAKRSGGVRIRIAFAGHRHAATLPVIYNQKATIVGQVLNDGRPVAGASVQAYGNANGDAYSLLGTLTADAHGIVSGKVLVRTTESIVLVAGPARSRVLTMRATAAMSLHASARTVAPGARISFQGRTSPVIPAGLLVFLQVHRGRSWRVFKAVRTSRTGVFSGAYRFDMPSARYAIRAEIPDQAGFALTTSVSRPLTVTVR